MLLVSRPPSPSPVPPSAGARPPGAVPGSRRAADPQTAPTEPALAAPPSSRGAQVLPGDYALRERVHAGRAAEVWRAAAPSGQRVAIKIAADAAAAAAARFAVEARALASLTHRSIVRLLGHGEAGDGRPFLALEWLEGRTAAGLLADRGAGIPPSDALRLMMPIASALVLAHDRGVVHGAVRADNVLVMFRGDGVAVPKLIDFASSQRIAPSAPPPSPDEPTRRVEAAVDAGDPVVDVRGFAATIFHLIAGRAPFTPAAGASYIPRTGLSERDAALWRILAEGLAPPPGGRFRRVSDLARELAAWAGLRGVDADITGSPISARWR